MEVSWIQSEKGQATIIDSLLFLLLSASLATTLFYFTIPYGIEQQAQLENRYLQSYTSSVFKALLWSPVARPGDVSDFLLAFSKETFNPTDKSFPTDIHEGFATNLFELNRSVNANHDYVFTIFEGASGIGKPILTVYKLNDLMYYCEDTSPANLRDFINNAELVTSSEGIVTYGSTVYKTLFLIWPKGANSMDNILHNSNPDDWIDFCSDPTDSSTKATCVQGVTSTACPGFR